MNPYPLLVRMYISAIATENSMEAPQKTKQTCHMIQQFHSWGYT
jgi:hypothetical protein